MGMINRLIPPWGCKKSMGRGGKMIQLRHRPRSASREEANRTAGSPTHQAGGEQRRPPRPGAARPKPGRATTPGAPHTLCPPHFQASERGRRREGAPTRGARARRSQGAGGPQSIPAVGAQDPARPRAQAKCGGGERREAPAPHLPPAPARLRPAPSARRRPRGKQRSAPEAEEPSNAAPRRRPTAQGASLPLCSLPRGQRARNRPPRDKAKRTLQPLRGTAAPASARSPDTPLLALPAAGAALTCAGLAWRASPVADPDAESAPEEPEPPPLPSSPAALPLGTAAAAAPCAQAYLLLVCKRGRARARVLGARAIPPLGAPRAAGRVAAPRKPLACLLGSKPVGTAHAAGGVSLRCKCGGGGGSPRPDPVFLPARLGGGAPLVRLCRREAHSEERPEAFPPSHARNAGQALNGREAGLWLWVQRDALRADPLQTPPKDPLGCCSPFKTFLRLWEQKVLLWATLPDTDWDRAPVPLA